MIEQQYPDCPLITQEKFKMAFTKVYGTQSIQDDRDSSSFFISIKIFLASLSNEDHNILKKSHETLFRLRQRFKNIINSKVENYYQFGCSLIFEKTSKESFTKIYLVANQSWGIDVRIKQQTTELFSIPLPGFKIFTIGQITQQKSLQIVSRKFLKILNEIYSSQENQKGKYNKTPSWIYQLAKTTLENYQHPKKQENPKIFSKGGTLYVGNHTGTTKPDTLWCVSWAVWYFYIKDQQLIKVLMTVFKCEVLKSQIGSKISKLKKRDDYQERKKLIVSFGKCLQDLRGQFTVLHIHNNPYFDNTKSCEIVCSINSMISQLNFHCQQRFFKREETGRKEEIQIFSLNIHKLYPNKQSQITNSQQNMNNLSKTFKVNFSKMILNLIQTYSSNNYQWLLVVEDCMFTYVYNQLSKQVPFSQLRVNILKSNGHSVNHQSKLRNLLMKYESVILIRNPKSDDMECQLHSHYELMKVLICVIGFEVFRRQNQETIFQIEDYRVPINIQSLYNNFNSLSHKARKVVEKLLAYYNKNNWKTEFFSQSLGYKNYSQYAQRVSKRSEMIKNSYMIKMRQLEQKKDRLKFKINEYHREYKIYLQQLQRLLENKTKNCSCVQKNYEGSKYDYSMSSWISFIRTQLIKCNYCLRYDEKKEYFQKFERKDQEQIQTKIPSKDGLVHEFFYSLGKFDEFLGLLNLILICQHGSSRGYSNSQNALTIFSNGYVEIESTKQNRYKFRLKNTNENEIQSYVKYSCNQINIKWNNNIKPTICYDKMNQREKQYVFDGPFEKCSIFLDNPEEPPKNTRQHRIYATLKNRHASLTAQEYIAVGSCLTGFYTEIPIALEHIQKRHIRFDTLSTSYLFQKLVVLRSFSRIKSMIPMNTTDQLLKNVFKGNIFFLRTFLNKYHQKWTSQDFSSLIVIGPLISLIIKTLEDQKKQKLQFLFIDMQKTNQKTQFSEILTKIANKWNFQYNRLQEDVLSNSGESAQYVNENKANQCFISFTGICCFTENIIGCNDQLAVEFVKMIVIFRFNQIYLQATKDLCSYEKTIAKYSFLKKRAEQMNMRKVLMYFLKNLKDLTKVVKIVDDVIDEQTDWTKDSNGQYLFVGKDRFKNTYKIDIKHGKTIKNGQTVSRIPCIFKELQQYKKIFGERNFEVYPAPKGNSFITQRNFSDLLQGSIAPKDVVFFQFGFEGQKPIINMIIRNTKDGIEKTWRLLETNEILKEVPLPKIFTQNSFAWYCKNLNCIVFRRINLANIGEIVLIMFLENVTGMMSQQIAKISIVSRQHEKSNLSKLCDPNIQIFNRLIVRKQNNSKAYEVLSRIENKDFILEVQSIEQNRRKFLLHRFDLFFVQDETFGLLPENFKFYRLAQNAYSHSNIPWSENDKIPCLVLQKYVHNEMTQQSHKIKLLIPQQLIELNGKIKICDKTNSKRNIFLYDIHDHFRDIRGPDRVSQLHLASILCTVNKNLSNNVSKMTELQYAIKVMKSCFGNIPLNLHEMEQVFNLFEIAVQIQSQTMVLLCYALLQSTKQIRQIKEETNTAERDYYEKKNTKKFRDTVSNKMNKYSWKLEDNRIPFREILPLEVAQIIGLRHEEKNQFSNKKNMIWKNGSKLKVDFLKYGFSSNIKKWKQCLEEWTSLNKQVMEQTIKSKEKVEHEFPLQIQNKRTNQLFKEVIQELDQSYKTHINTKNHNNNIEIQTFLMEHKFQSIKQKMKKVKIEIQEVIESVSMEIQNHIDFQSGISVTFGRFDFVDILIKENDGENQNDDYSILTGQFFQKIESDANSTQSMLDIISIIKLWILYCVKIDSCKRILQILNCKSENQKIDKIALFRQCESTRIQIQEKNYWICFEAELKIQIWKSQYETFETLMMKNKSGTALQLNMGQGKTQTIIPLIILELIYNKNLENYEIFKEHKTQGKKVKKIPRVNLMEALINQSKLNYFKLLSITAFNIPLFILPFSRSMKLTSQQCFNAVSRSISFYKAKMIMILDQSSTHSLILKLREQSLRLKNTTEFNKQTTVFREIDTFDVFDEVDAQLTPKKSFIYSVGGHNILDQCKYRIEIAQKILESICKCVKILNEKSLLCFDETIPFVQKSLDMYEFPKGLRLLPDSLQAKDKRRNFRTIILQVLLEQVQCNLYTFLKTLNESEMDSVKEYLIEEEMNVQSLKGSFTDSAKNVLLILRGYLAYGILEHCLSLRCNVNYGIPDKQRKKSKRLAIPYEAADIPSKKNDYAHPQVAILLSYLSYYNFGLTEEQVLEGFQTLFIIAGDNETARQNYFKEWLNTLEVSERKKLQIENTLQIKLHSLSQRKKLFEVFRFNRKFIAFWLKFCVFEKDTSQFEKSITSSSWDHANVRSLVGFSGTKDNCKLLPTYVKLINSESQVIMGTDGRMLDLFLENVLEVIDVINSDEPLWQRFLNTVFSLPQNYNISSIIDAGAILASKSLKDFIVPWISKKQIYNVSKKFKGISFCSEDSWKVFKLSSQEFIQRGSSISDNETFVIFDESRTRGADLKMSANIAAVLTLSPNLTKDNLMQAVGRLRKLGRNQKIVVILTEEVKMKISREVSFDDKMTTKQKAKAILSWCCINSVDENEKLLAPNAKLAAIHFQNLQNKKIPFTNTSNTTVKSMYQQPVAQKTIFQTCEMNLSGISRIEFSQGKESKIMQLKSIFKKYGEKTRIKTQNFNEICQWQSQIVRETFEQRQIESVNLNQLPQEDIINSKQLSSFIKFKFSSKFKITDNFFKVSKSSITSNQSNQLMASHFILLDPKNFTMITQRQVDILLKMHLSFYEPETNDFEKRFIARFSDISINDSYLRKNNLVQAFVQCKFFNGVSQFENQQELQIIRKLILFEEKRDEKAKHFLMKRRQIFKFPLSTLERILKDLCLISLDKINKQEWMICQ